MSRPTIQIGDEVREMTSQEFTEWKEHVLELEARAAAADAKAAAITSARAKLTALGLSEAEVSALLGG
jgi:hypothetical protein